MTPPANPSDAPDPARAEDPAGGRLPWAALAALVAAFLWDSILAGRAFVMRDQIYDFLPWRRFAAEAAREGSIPLWNPYARFGQPFVANPQSAFFYPPHHLFDVLPVRWAFTATLAFHMLVAAAGMHALLRRFRLAPEAAMLGAVAFAFGAYFTANLEFMSVMDTLAWAPLTVLLACRAGDAWAGRAHLRSLARPVVLLALVVALQVTAGQVQVLVYTAFAALVLGVAVALAEGRRAAAGATAAALAAAGLLGGCVALVQVLPTLELLPHSVRSAGVDAGLDIASMPPRQLATLVLPLALGRPGRGEWWCPGLFEFWLGAIHVGLVPLVCVTVAAAARRAADPVVRRVAAAAAAVCVLGVLIAMGRHTPVYGLLQALPGAAMVRWPAKGLQLTAIALPVLAAVGFDALLRRRDDAAARGLRGPVVVLALAGVAAAALAAAAASGSRGLFEAIAGGPVPGTSEVDAFLLRDCLRSAAFLAAGAAALAAAAHSAVPRRAGAAAVVVVAFANLLLVSRDVHHVGDPALLTPAAPQLPPPPGPVPGHVFTEYPWAGFEAYGARHDATWAAASSVLAGAVGMAHGISSTNAGDALQVERCSEVVSFLQAAPPQIRGRLADVLAVDREIRGPPFAEVLAGGAASRPRFTARPTALPRAFLADRWETAADRTVAMERLLAPDLDPRRTAVEDSSSGAPPLPPSPPWAGPGAPGRVVAVRPGRDRVDVEIDAERPCLLVLCETWLPGWTATVDGAERPVRRVNVLFRGVPVGRGERVVSFVYRPPAFRAGAAGSLAALAVAAGLWVVGRRRVTT